MKYKKINEVGNSKRGFTDLTASVVGLLSLLSVFEASACQSSGWSVVGLLSIQKVIMLRPLLQEGRLIRRVSSGLLSLREFSRPPLTGARGLYALQRRLFTSWCGDRQLDPVNCPICTALEFVQTCFSAGFTHSTLKVYVAALPAHRTLLGGHSVVRHPKLHISSTAQGNCMPWSEVHFMVRRSPARPSQLPDWSSSGVRAGLSLHGVYSLHPEGLRGGFTGPPRCSRWPFSR